MLAGEAVVLLQVERRGMEGQEVAVRVLLELLPQLAGLLVQVAVAADQIKQPQRVLAVQA